ncbi:MAG: hypothetical protein ACLQQ4_05265 [Bacteroidia bacterium]
MKNLSLILASLVLFAGVSFANPVVKGVKKQDNKQQPVKKDEKKPVKKTEKKEVKKADTKPAADKK